MDLVEVTVYYVHFDIKWWLRCSLELTSGNTWNWFKISIIETENKPHALLNNVHTVLKLELNYSQSQDLTSSQIQTQPEKNSSNRKKTA